MNPYISAPKNLLYFSLLTSLNELVNWKIKFQSIHPKTGT